MARSLEDYRGVWLFQQAHIDELINMMLIIDAEKQVSRKLGF